MTTSVERFTLTKRMNNRGEYQMENKTMLVDVGREAVYVTITNDTGHRRTVSTRSFRSFTFKEVAEQIIEDFFDKNIQRLYVDYTSLGGGLADKLTDLFFEKGFLYDKEKGTVQTEYKGIIIKDSNSGTVTLASDGMLTVNGGKIKTQQDESVETKNIEDKEHSFTKEKLKITNNPISHSDFIMNFKDSLDTDNDLPYWFPIKRFSNEELEELSLLADTFLKLKDAFGHNIDNTIYFAQHYVEGYERLMKQSIELNKAD